MYTLNTDTGRLVWRNVGAGTNGVVIATEKRLPTTLIDESSLEKISVIDDGIGMVYSGTRVYLRVCVVLLLLWWVV